ncbi:hypothetical protein [Thermofilum sp.]|uniref:hypothetical protein n=1 Tax=Thermofilum sp. TaxID=1961369 RepID=UPI003166F464
MGNDIWVYGRDDIRVMAWFIPVVNDWESWKVCFLNSSDIYFTGLVNRVGSMFNLHRASLIGYGIYEAERKVYVILRFSLSDSGFYNSELDSLTFQDIFKPYGGYFDEVHLYYQIPIYGVSPPPTVQRANEVHWINPSYEKAPTSYTIYFSPIITILVEASGLPPGVRTRVYVNNAYKGEIEAGKSLEITVKKASYTVSVDPEINVGSGVKYVVSQSSFTTSESSRLTFQYTKMVKVILSTAVFIDGASYSPGEHWLRAGTHTLRVEFSPKMVSSVERIVYLVDKWIISGKEYSGNPVSVNIDSDEKPVSITVRLFETREFYVSIKGGGRDLEGWYPEGARIEVDTESVRTLGTGVRDVFQGWYEGGRLYSKSTRLVVTLDKPVNLEARWMREFLVTVQDPLNASAGGGWYPAGSAAEVRVASEVIKLQEDVIALFKGWEGDVSTREAIARFTVDSPKSLRAVWSRAYRVFFDPSMDVSYSIDGCSLRMDGCWAEEGSPIVVRLSASGLGFPVKYVLEGFAVTGLTRVQQDPQAGYLEGIVQGPVYVKAYWKSDYTILVIIAAVVMLSIGAFAFIQLTKSGIIHPPPQIIKLLKLTVKSETQIIQEKTETIAVKGAIERALVSSEIEKLESELKKYIDYLSRLESMRSEGQISEEVYYKLKEEYNKELEKIEKELEKLKKINI